MKKIRLFTCFLILLILSSCSIMNIDSDTLLSTPKMNTTDQGILKALEIECSSYKLISPISGSFQTAVIQYDINNDSKNDAVCFYSDGSSNFVNLLVLSEENSVWKKVAKYESAASSVDRVNFCDLTENSYMEITVGWKFQSGEEKALEVLTFNNNESLKTIYSGMCNAFAAFENSLVIISRNTGGKTASASLIGKNGGTLTILKTLSLNNSISSFLSIQVSQIDDNTQAIYIDEQLDSLSYITEVLTINNKNMQKSSDTINSKTIRSRAYVCTDIDGDKRFELPVEKTFPSYIRKNASEYLTYVDWMTFDGTNVQKLVSSYTSINEQFILELPDNWFGNITVQKDESTERAIHFYYIDNGQNKPMFSIRVFSQQEYTDTEKQLGWNSIATSNENVYTFRSNSNDIPDNFKMDIDKITELFKIIS